MKTRIPKMCVISFKRLILLKISAKPIKKRKMTRKSQIKTRQIKNAKLKFKNWYSSLYYSYVIVGSTLFLVSMNEHLRDKTTWKCIPILIL